MESTGVPGRIQISRTTYERVHDMGLEFEERQVEGKSLTLCDNVNTKYLDIDFAQMNAIN